MRREESPFRRSWRRLLRNRLAVVGMIFLALLLAAAAVGPEVWRWKIDQEDSEYIQASLDEEDARWEREDAARADFAAKGLRGAELTAAVAESLGPKLYPLPGGPSWRHPFGIDPWGADLFARTLHGARISLAVGLLASLIALCVGMSYGAIAGYLGGRLDQAMMRLVDIIYGIPFLLFVIVFILVFEGDITKGASNPLGAYSRMYIIFFALGLTYWLPMARIVRSKVLTLKTNDFATAARAMGAGHARILFRHLLPNAMGAIIVTLTLSIPEAIFAEAFLAYIGLGISAPVRSWGTLAAEGTEYIRQAPYLLFFPAMMISATMLAFNFLGDGLRDAFDPRMTDEDGA